MKQGTLRNILFLSITAGALLFIGCAGGKGSSSESVNSSGGGTEEASVQASPELDSLKQSAESAEWEAHRLREQVFRKKQAQ